MSGFGDMGAGGRGARQRRMSEQQADIQRVAERERDSREQLENELEHLRLVTKAMWTLMAEPLGLTMQKLIERIDAIDASDGKLDGRHTPPPRPCTRCEAAVPPDRRTCQFCGTDVPGADVWLC